MPIDWSHDYGFDGWMGYRDAANERSYIMGAEDGTLQSVLNEDGTITAAGGNIVLGSNGMAVHDLSDASIITPALGVGWIHDTLPSSEDFTVWTLGGTASATGDTQQAPSGEAASADTISLPASGDYVTRQTIASPTLANGQSAAFMVYLKAATAGTIRLQVGTSSGGSELGALDFSVLSTNWRRAVLIYTNGTGGAVRPYVTIKRNSAGQLASVYAWGAQMAYDVDKEVPYWNLQISGLKQWGVAMRSPLFLTHETTGSVLIGGPWTALPAGSASVYVGKNAGSNSSITYGVSIGGGASVYASGLYPVHIGGGTGLYDSGNYSVFVGCEAGDTNYGDRVIGLGKDAGSGNNYDEVVFIGGGVATANNQFVIGGGGVEYKDLYLGRGVTSASPPASSINATGGSGTNIAGGSLTLAGGKGTGSGAGGSLLFKTAPAGASGSSLNSLATAFEITGEGTLDFKNSPVVNFSGGGGGSVNRWRLMFGA